MGILGGALFGVAQADFTWVRYVRASLDALFLRDIVTGLVKSVMFGITITAVGCYEGLLTGAGAEQVGRSTTRAVVVSIFLDRKSTRLNSSHGYISYAVFCLKKKRTGTRSLSLTFPGSPHLSAAPSTASC